jgi:prepilin-type N-terminal cleavage/methylation domain-containing protein
MMTGILVYHSPLARVRSYCQGRLNRKRTARAGFTLVELLVVIAIIGIIVATMLPVLNATNEAARRMQCRDNLIQIGMALQDYTAYYQVFPPGTTASAGPVQNLPNDLHHSWLVRLLPQLDKPGLYEAIDFQQSIYSDANATARGVAVAEFLCASDPVDGVNPPPSNYAGSHHHQEDPIDETNMGVLFLHSAIGFDQLTDGRGQTMVAGEKIWTQNDLGWASGTSATLRNTGHPLLPRPPDPQKETKETEIPPALFVGGFRSRHPTCVNFLFADGAVQSLDTQTDQKVLQTLANRADGLPLSWPQD